MVSAISTDYPICEPWSWYNWYMHTYMTGWFWTRANVGEYSSTLPWDHLDLDSETPHGALRTKARSKPWEFCGMGLSKWSLNGTSPGKMIGWWFEPLWKILVTWDYCSQYMESHKNSWFQTTNQNDDLSWDFTLISPRNMHILFSNEDLTNTNNQPNMLV